MTYGPPPNQNWQQPPLPPPGFQPSARLRPPLSGTLVIVGILGLLLAAAAFFGHTVVGYVPMLVAIVGSVLVFARQRAGAILLAIAGGLVILMTVLGILRRTVGFPPGMFTFRVKLEIDDDGFSLVRLLLAIAVLVLSLIRPTTEALGGRPAQPRPGYSPQPLGHGAPPGYGPPPAGYGPPPGHRPPPPNQGRQQPPPGWR
ncbi:hypothetical protein [Kibdelosporangium phytohabitans]|uniref:Uncharacterized protein n=1 Tax=Kibdelosporangium phytohabitans TaxID=860235 RepID=A0A0N9IBP4_9PSEU|nr:hypothetical protein [Kibdelosporangium phytohabitans]ALG13843.1 hypothetical protein AOZ06_49490 [Kibdelosporangium phytohabitans]MBE1467228.1 hypothetical protein [Kibdelosporangium phytohabitans]